MKDDVGYFEYIDGQVLERLWFRFKREGIRIPFPIRDVYIHKPADEKQFIDGVVSILKKVDFLAEMPREKLVHLAKNCDIEYFTEGETVCKAGAQGDTFYIIKTGAVDIHVLIGDKDTVVRTLKDNEFFGEMSLLTGEPRTATVKISKNAELLVLTKEDFVDLIKKEPELAEMMSRVIAYRDKAIQEYKTGTLDSDILDGKDKEEEARNNLKTKIFSKIKTFFLIDIS